MREGDLRNGFQTFERVDRPLAAQDGVDQHGCAVGEKKAVTISRGVRDSFRREHPVSPRLILDNETVSAEELMPTPARPSAPMVRRQDLLVGRRTLVSFTIDTRHARHQRPGAG